MAGKLQESPGWNRGKESEEKTKRNVINSVDNPTGLSSNSYIGLIYFESAASG